MANGGVIPCGRKAWFNFDFPGEHVRFYSEQTFDQGSRSRTGTIAEIALRLAPRSVKVSAHPHVTRAKAEIHRVEHRTFEQRIRGFGTVCLPIRQRGVRGFRHDHVVERPGVRHPTRRRQREISSGHARTADRKMRDLRIYKTRHLPSFQRRGHV